MIRSRYRCKLVSVQLMMATVNYKHESVVRARYMVGCVARRAHNLVSNRKTRPQKLKRRKQKVFLDYARPGDNFSSTRHAIIYSSSLLFIINAPLQSTRTTRRGGGV
jgi:hypothetical protein